MGEGGAQDRGRQEQPREVSAASGKWISVLLLLLPPRMLMFASGSLDAAISTTSSATTCVSGHFKWTAATAQELEDGHRRVLSRRTGPNPCESTKKSL
jgi:hypothetical protein